MEVIRTLEDLLSEFVVIGEPVSLNAAKGKGQSKKKNVWKEKVRNAAKGVWPSRPVADLVSVSMLYGYGTIKRDVDNVPKFVLDALKGVTIKDDDQIEKLKVERVSITEPDRIQNATSTMAVGFSSGKDFIYVPVRKYSGDQGIVV